jgi:hypothetical protein
MKEFCKKHFKGNQWARESLSPQSPTYCCGQAQASDANSSKLPLQRTGLRTMAFLYHMLFGALLTTSI